MKEFVEKLIERLEEESDSASDKINEQQLDSDMLYYDGFEDGCDKAIEIVNQLAEEYNPSKSSSLDNLPGPYKPEEYLASTTQELSKRESQPNFYSERFNRVI